jgi:hypothetical protein
MKNITGTAYRYVGHCYFMIVRKDVNSNVATKEYLSLFFRELD